MADEIGTGRSGIGAWIAVLRDHGYISDAGDQLVLKIDSGPTAPAVNTSTRTIRDWNLRPPMDPARLKAALDRFGGSTTEWLRSHGRHPQGVTRLHEMVRGTRAISDEVAKLVETDERRQAGR